MGQRQAYAAGKVSAVGADFQQEYQQRGLQAGEAYSQMQQRYQEALETMEQRYEEVIPATRVGRLGAWVQTQFKHAIGIPSPEALPLKKAIGIEVPHPEFVELPGRLKRIRYPEVARQFQPTVSILPSEKETSLTYAPRKRRTFDNILDEQQDQLRSAGKDVDIYGRQFQRMRDRFHGDRPDTTIPEFPKTAVGGVTDIRTREIIAAGITPPPPPGIGKGVQLPYYEKTIPFTGITYAAFKGGRPYAGREYKKPVSMRYSVLESYTPKVTELAEGRKAKRYVEIPSVWKSQVISFPSKRTQLLKVVKERPPHREKLPQVPPPDYRQKMVAGRMRKEAYKQGQKIAKRIEELEATDYKSSGLSRKQYEFQKRTQLNELRNKLDKAEAAARKPQSQKRGVVEELPRQDNIEQRIFRRGEQTELFGHTTPLRPRREQVTETPRERVTSQQLRLNFGTTGTVSKNHLEKINAEQRRNAEEQRVRERGWAQTQRQINERIERDQEQARKNSEKKGELITLFNRSRY